MIHIQHKGKKTLALEGNGRTSLFGSVLLCIMGQKECFAMEDTPWEINLNPVCNQDTSLLKMHTEMSLEESSLLWHLQQLASSLVCLELYKVIAVEHPIEDYRNTFANLALLLFPMAELVPAKVMKYQTLAGPSVLDGRACSSQGRSDYCGALAVVH